MDEINHDLEQAHYHFAVSEIVYYISQYGIDNVMTDIYDYLEVQKKEVLEQGRVTLTQHYESMTERHKRNAPNNL